MNCWSVWSVPQSHNTTTRSCFLLLLADEAWIWQLSYFKILYQSILAWSRCHINQFMDGEIPLTMNKCPTLYHIPFFLLMDTAKGHTFGRCHSSFKFEKPPECLGVLGWRSQYSNWLRTGQPRGQSLSPSGGWEFSLIYVIQNSTGAHSASYPIGIGGFFPGG
jgi:hypothetical protein